MHILRISLNLRKKNPADLIYLILLFILIMNTEKEKKEHYLLESIKRPQNQNDIRVTTRPHIKHFHGMSFNIFDSMHDCIWKVTNWHIVFFFSSKTTSNLIGFIENNTTIPVKHKFSQNCLVKSGKIIYYPTFLFINYLH